MRSRVFSRASFSRMFPWDSEIFCSKSFSNNLSYYYSSFLALAKPCLFTSISGYSFSKYIFSTCVDREWWVIRKLTKVTLVESSGENWMLESLVSKNSLKLLLKSISWSPTWTRFLPPFLCTSLFSIYDRIGGRDVIPSIRIGSPNLRHFSRTLLKLLSLIETLSILLY